MSELQNPDIAEQHPMGADFINRKQDTHKDPVLKFIDDSFNDLGEKYQGNPATKDLLSELASEVEIIDSVMAKGGSVSIDLNVKRSMKLIEQLKKMGEHPNEIQ